MADDAEWTPKQDMSLLCRVCANQHDYLIPIFQGEGLDHDMPTKMDKHLPIKVRESDKLPTQMCYQCASTIIAWSELHTNCLAADKKLKGMLRINEKKMGVVDTADDDAGSDHYEDAYDDGGGGGDDDDEDFEKEIKQLISDAGVELGSKTAKASKRPSRAAATRKRKSEVTITPVKRETKKPKTEPSASKSSTALLKPKEEVVSNEDRCIEVWSCCTCERYFSSHSGLRSHLLSHADVNVSNESCSTSKLINHTNDDKAKRRSFTCYYCEELFTEKSTLQLHMKIIHAALYMTGMTSWYTCKECPKKLYKNCQGIIRHMLFAHDENNINPKEYVVNSMLDITYECNICNRRCYLTKTCSVHRPNSSNVQNDDSHSNISNECEEHVSLHVCTECDSKHDDCQALWSHVYQHHKNSSVKCNLCKTHYFAASKNGTRHIRHIIRHMLKAHKKSIILEECYPNQAEKQFWKEFKNKCRTDVKGKTVFSCPYCPKVLQTFGSLQSHLNIHTKDRKYVCEVCGAWFLHTSSLIAHKTTHTDMKFKCDFCGKSYAHRNHLRRHIDQVHVNKWKSKCKICNKVFQDVRTHAAVHSTDRPFVCTLCGSTYKWKKHLTRHEKICKTSKTT